MQLSTTIAGLRQEVAARRQAGDRVAFVPTMGALHYGHLALVRRALELADVVVVSIFVNPLQFGAGEDLDRYPRTLDADTEALARTGAHIVFAPTAQEMYPDGQPQTRVAAGTVATLFEGATRPGHFDGMLTVVNKLLNIVAPDVVLFGQKDAQQVFLVRQMVADLNLSVEVEEVETVREAGGLALSSRNRYLSDVDREAALALSAALDAARQAAAAADGDAGTGPASAARAAGRTSLAARPGIETDYFDIVDATTFLPAADDFRGDAIAIVAARVGTTRLIDNQRIRIR